MSHHHDGALKTTLDDHNNQTPRRYNGNISHWTKFTIPQVCFEAQKARTLQTGFIIEKIFTGNYIIFMNMLNGPHTSKIILVDVMSWK